LPNNKRTGIKNCNTRLLLHRYTPNPFISIIIVIIRAAIPFIVNTSFVTMSEGIFKTLISLSYIEIITNITTKNHSRLVKLLTRRGYLLILFFKYTQSTQIVIVCNYAHRRISISMLDCVNSEWIVPVWERGNRSNEGKFWLLTTLTKFVHNRSKLIYKQT
jgi:hypothetical protein